MISIDLILFLGMGTVAMLIQMIFRRGIYKIPLWKCIFIAVFLTLAGTIGAMLMFYIENGSLGGRSFFGALLFIPVLMCPIAILLKVPFGMLMDLCAPAECIMLAILKVDCLINDCCYGRIICSSNTVGVLRFPSQIVEMIVILVIMICLMIQEKSYNSKNKLYLVYLLLYGATRFVLNWLRGDLTPFVWGLPAGSFWAMCSVIIGSLGLLLFRRKDKIYV